MINVHTNGKIFEFELFGFNFRNTEVTRFTRNRRPIFLHLKLRIENKLPCSQVAQIIYKIWCFLQTTKLSFSAKDLR